MASSSVPSRFSGKITVRYGDDINTDYIIPAYLLQEAWGKRYFAEHAFERYDPSFVNTCQMSNDNIVVAGKNFGCGSSREQAVYAIQYNNVKAVIAESFPDIFYRNSINNGFPALAVESTRELKLGDDLAINLEKLTVTRRDEKEGDLQLHILMAGGEREILQNGSRLQYVKERLRRRLTN